MNVEIYNGFQLPVVMEATRLVVRDDQGTPIAVVIRVGDGYQFINASDPGFAASLAMFGLPMPTVTRGPALGGSVCAPYDRR